MKQIPIEKYHALGNDFIVIDLAKSRVAEGQKPAVARRVCDRHEGAGADGVVFFSMNRGRYTMRIFNADGSEAELSGNGLRILAHYLIRSGVTRKREFTVYSSVGSNSVIIRQRKGLVLESSVYLPAPKFATAAVPMKVKQEFFINAPFACDAGELIATAVNVGNPHLVVFVDNFEFEWREFGKVAEVAREFPEQVNVEFARIVSRKKVEHKIWERGAGETSASGSGAAAVAAAGVMIGLLDHEVMLHEPAGVLKASITSLSDPIMITGPSRFIYSGSFTFDKNA